MEIFRRKIRAAILFGIAIPISASCLLKAQQSPSQSQTPSLAETKKWVEQTFRDGSHIVNKSFESIDFDAPDNAPCYMTFIVREQIGLDIRFWDFVNLADIDPDSIKASSLIHDTDITTVKDPDQVNYQSWAVKDHPYVYVSMRTANDKESVKAELRLSADSNGTATSSRQPTKSQLHEAGFPLEGIAVEPDYAQTYKGFAACCRTVRGKPVYFLIDKLRRTRRDQVGCL